MNIKYVLYLRLKDLVNNSYS